MAATKVAIMNNRQGWTRSDRPKKALINVPVTNPTATALENNKAKANTSHIASSATDGHLLFRWGIEGIGRSIAVFVADQEHGIAGNSQPKYS